MYLYELAVATGERSTDLIERAKLLGFEIGPHEELTSEQVEALAPGHTAAAGPLGGPADPSAAGHLPSDPVPAPGAEDKPKRSLRRRPKDAGVDSPDAGPVIAGPGAGGIRRWVAMAVPVAALALVAAWFITKGADDVDGAGPDEAKIGLQVRSEKLTGDPYGVSDRARFCDGGGRLIILANAGGVDPSTADLRRVWVDRQRDMAEHMVAVVASTEGETQAEAKEYRQRMNAISGAVAALPQSARVDSIPRSAKEPLLRALREMDGFEMPRMEAAMAAHC